MADQNPAPSAHIDGEARIGLISGLTAYAIWGIMPVYFHALAGVPPEQIVVHRILWSVILLLGILVLRGRMAAFRAAITDKKLVGALMGSALLIAFNWLLYIWAVLHQHVVAASLGYFLSPLLHVLMGRSLLGERLNKTQWLSVAMAAVGVAVLSIGAFSAMWISVALALSFGLYGLVRKKVVVGPMVGLSVETLVLMPFGIAAMLYWGARDEVTFGVGIQHILLPLAGVITAIPLLLFAMAARRLTLSTLGLLQYVGPSIQLLLGLFVYGEHLTPAHKIAFPLIWGALCLYSWGAMRQPKTSPA